MWPTPGIPTTSRPFLYAIERLKPRPAPRGLSARALASSRHRPAFELVEKIFDVVLGPSTWEGMILMTPIFSALNQYNEVDGGFPEDFTMPDAETELVSKYSSGEKGWLTNRFGYDPQIWDSGATTLGEQAMFLIEGLIEQITTDEIANQVINNVVEYGNIKQDELTSIATEEQQPSTEVSDVGTAMRAATPHNTIQDIYTQKTEL